MQRLGLTCSLAALGIFLFAVGGLSSCSDGDGYGLPGFDSGVPDGGFVLPDGSTADGGGGPLPQDPGGPTIEILAPEESEVITTTLLEVRVAIADEDGVDDSSIKAGIEGDEDSEVKLTITSTPGVYKATIDVSEKTGTIRLWVTAADLLGNGNTAVVAFERDAGSVIAFISPAEAARARGSMTVSIRVTDPFGLDRFEARIGNTLLDLSGRSSGDDEEIYSGTIVFDSPDFWPPLTGEQQISVLVENLRGTITTARQGFVVDDAGPQIAILSQNPGEFIGGIIELRVAASDPAGILAGSVRCLVGHVDQDGVVREVVLQPEGGGVYAELFDTRRLSPFFLWPTISCRAADTLGNESYLGIEVILDNIPPILELDPPDDHAYYHWREKTVDGATVYQLSKPFDPVGGDAANDGQVVGQIQDIRVRIEDRGNTMTVPSAEWGIVSGVNDEMVRMYLLDDTSRPLVIDSTGDGYCDSINPDVLPLGSRPLPHQAVSLRLAPVSPSGSADFTPYGDDWDSIPWDELRFGFQSGDDTDPPKNLCRTVLMTRAPYATGQIIKTIPSLYTIPPVGPTGDESLNCLGVPFDFRANGFADGWACVAAAAADNMGNKGVSRPIRLWVDKDGVSPPWDGEPMPHCTGTLNRETGVVTNTPCVFCDARYCTVPGPGGTAVPIARQVYSPPTYVEE